MKIVLNRDCYNPYELSAAAKIRYIELKSGMKTYPYIHDTENKKWKKVTWGYGYGKFISSDLGKEVPDELMDTQIDYNIETIERNDLILVQVVEELGSDANMGDDLEIIEIPDGVDWIIERDGEYEWVSEKHLIWGK